MRWAKYWIWRVDWRNTVAARTWGGMTSASRLKNDSRCECRSAGLRRRQVHHHKCSHYQRQRQWATYSQWPWWRLHSRLRRRAIRQSLLWSKRAKIRALLAVQNNTIKTGNDWKLMPRIGREMGSIEMWAVVRQAEERDELSDLNADSIFLTISNYWYDTETHTRYPHIFNQFLIKTFEKQLELINALIIK